MFLHGFWRKHNRIENVPESSFGTFRGILKAVKAQGPPLGNQGFTLFELIIVIALLAIVIGLAAVGIGGYFDAADQMERQEVAETSFYSLQSHVNYLKRKGELDKFEEQICSYNQSVYGQDNILSADQNRTIIELNYEGGDPSAFYNDEYLPAHQESEIVYITLDSSQSGRESNPLYPILSAALQNEEAMKNSFLVEYDLSTGVVRSVFYSEEAEVLGYHFTASGSVESDRTDCIYRDAKNLQDKKQGYYGLTFTASEYAVKALELLAPKEVKLVNEDRLYLTWMEENSNNAAFTGGEYQIEELTYIVTLYDQDDKEIAIYELMRGDLYEDETGTQAAVLNYIDDFSTPVEDTLVNSTKQARAGFADLAYEEAPDGIAGEYYYLLLECLDHPFGDNGYDFDPADTMYATVELSYGAEGTAAAEEIVDSNEESVYFAHVEDETGAQEFGVACNRHLWNIRHGAYDGAYRLIADVDWTNIEERARVIDFTSTQFEDESVAGLYHSFEGTFNGAKTGEAAQGAGYLYSNYEINGVSIAEEENENVGLFTVNMGTIENITLSNFSLSGAKRTGALAGLNMGTMENICVLNVAVAGKREAGGLTGYNQGTVVGCTATTGANRITGERFLGGLVGYSVSAVKDSQTACNVEFVLPEGTEKFTSNTLGRYIGGVIGYVEAGASAENLQSGVLLDTVTGLPVVDDNGVTEGNTTVQYTVALGEAGDSTESEAAVVVSERVCSCVTGVAYVGGIIGDIETGAGEFTKLYNYAKLNVSYINAEERTARGDASSKIYNFYGGIVGNLYAGNGLKDCVNYAVVALDFLEDGQPCDATEIYDYISQYPANAYYYNCPRYIGGIVGYNRGTVEDCISLCSDYGTFEEELDEYEKVRKGEAGCYVGAYAGGLIGYNAGTVLFTNNLAVDTMQVVVKAYAFSNGGLVGYAGEGSIKNESGMLTVQGVVASRGSENPQNQGTVTAFETTGGVVGRINGGEFGGEYTNDAYVMGMCSGGITAYLAKGYTLDYCHNTGIVLGRGLLRGHCQGSGTGGIAGFNHGTLTNCSNTGTVSSTPYMKDIPGDATEIGLWDPYIGGVAGYNTGTVKNCHSKLNEEKDNYIASNNNAKLGGMVGYNYNNGINYNGVILTDSEEEVDLPIYVGGSNYINYKNRVGGIIGDAAGQLELSNFVYSGDIEIRHSFTIAHQGYGGIIGALNSDNQILSDCTMTGTITSKAIDTGGIVGFMTGGIIEESVEVTAEAVIEGTTYTGGVVGLTTANSAETHVDIMENKATVTGTNYVGGIAGYVAQGHTLDISNRKNSGKVTGVTYVGGIVGIYKMGTLTAVSGCENTGEVAGKTQVGGIIGTLSAGDLTVERSVSDFVNKGTVMGNVASGESIGGIIGCVAVPSDIQNCFNEGEVGQLDAGYNVKNVGGILGKIEQASTVANCDNKGTVRGGEKVAGIVGCVAAVSQIEECTNQALVGEVEEGDKTVSTGGIIGLITKNTTVEDCSNTKNITGSGAVGGIIGNISSGGGKLQVTVNNCVNEKDVQILSSAYGAGGIVGRGYCNYATANNGLLIMNQCYNYGSVDAPNGNGGMVGYLDYLGVNITDCHNYGTIGEHSEGRWQVYNAGGMIGWAIASADLEESFIKDCTQNANIYNITSINNNQGVGGIIGSAQLNLRLENSPCGDSDTSYTIETSGTAYALGGIVGVGTKNLTIINCDSNVEIVGTTKGIGVGGIVGCSSGKLAIGEAQNPDTYCDAYGDINLETGLQNCGGIVGTMHKSDFEIYGSTHYGDIGEKTATASYTGGIIGYVSLDIKQTANGLLQDCTQQGKIYNASNCVGGLIGNNLYHSTTIKNCRNGVEGVEDSGRIFVNVENAKYIGGFIGLCGGTSKATTSERVITLQQSVNYGDLYLQKTCSYVGGLIGQCTSSLSIGDAEDATLACYNYGDITGGADAASNYVGGFVGLISSLLSGNAHIYDAINYGTIGENLGGIACVGGIAGAVGQPGEFINCKNLGQILNASNTGTGGIAGSVTAADTVLFKNCINGSEEARLADETDGRITTSDNLLAKTTAAAGGIIGNATANLQLENCVNHADIAVNTTTSNSIGGICGLVGGQDTLLACVNYGNISTENITSNVGGIIGFATSAKTSTANVTTVGASADSSLACYNYGDILFNGEGTNKTIAGIVGVTNRPVHIYYCENYGDIGTADGTAKGNGLAGIIGQIKASYPSVITDCKQMGTIYQVISTAGGIAGNIYTDTTITNCANGTEDDEEVGRIYGLNGAAFLGGIAGLADNLTIENCTNYADIIGTGNIIKSGGIVGNSKNVTIGNETDSTKACINYGDIYGAGTENYLGGILGYGTTESAHVTIGIFDCANEGSIALGKYGTNNSGGIVGMIMGTYYGNNGSYRFTHTKIINCINNGPVLYGGTIEDTSQTYSGIGGIAGGVYGGAYHPDNEMGEVLVENCTNNGTIAWSGFAPTSGSGYGGIAGSCSGTIKNCVNNADIYTGSAAVGGIAGAAYEYTTTLNVVESVNNGSIYVGGTGSSVGGILGYANARAYYGYDKFITVTDCTNYGDIQLTAASKNTYIGGIMGRIYDAGTGKSSLTILRCENRGNVSNVYVGGGGIAGVTSGLDQYFVSNCINYGNITATTRLIHNGAWEQYGNIGGISGTTGGQGGFLHCVNLGTVSGDTGRLGGLFGVGEGGYMVNCYNLGTASTTGNERDGDVTGYLPGSGFMIDCYSVNATSGRLYSTDGDASIISDGHILWQASNVNGVSDYFTKESYESLCSVFGVASAWSDTDMLSNVKYLIANYKFNPDAPVSSNFVYTASSVDEEGVETSATIAWDVTTGNYFTASGMEVYLYESTMEDAEILADVNADGSNAFFHTTVNFAGNKIPSTITITYDDTLLPTSETETEITYKVVIKTLGYTTAEGAVVTEDTEPAIQGEVTLPAIVTATTLSLQSTVSDGDSTEEDYVDDTVSDGDSTEEDYVDDTVSGCDSTEDYVDDTVSDGDSTTGDSISGNNLAA